MAHNTKRARSREPVKPYSGLLSSLLLLWGSIRSSGANIYDGHEKKLDEIYVSPEGEANKHKAVKRKRTPGYA